MRRIILTIEEFAFNKYKKFGFIVKKRTAEMLKAISTDYKLNIRS